MVITYYNKWSEIHEVLLSPYCNNHVFQALWLVILVPMQSMCGCERSKS